VNGRKDQLFLRHLGGGEAQPLHHAGQAVYVTVTSKRWFAFRKETVTVRVETDGGGDQQKTVIFWSQETLSLGPFMSFAEPGDRRVTITSPEPRKLAVCADSVSDELIEHERWVTGRRLWAETKQADQQMPILFSAAEEHRGIIYWAIIDSVVIAENQTTCSYFDLMQIAPARQRSELVLRSGNRSLSDNLIRPYAIC
jgi:hypothetical protein